VDFKKLPRLTWSDLEKNYFQRKEVVRVKATGKEYPLMYIHINLDEPEKSSVSLDLNKNVYTNADDLKLSEIEKITNKEKSNLSFNTNVFNHRSQRTKK
jgi:hypothetical protein